MKYPIKDEILKYYNTSKQHIDKEPLLNLISSRLFSRWLSEIMFVYKDRYGLTTDSILEVVNKTNFLPIKEDFLLLVRSVLNDK